MLWVIVFAAIALAGLIMVVCYGVWLAHKASDVLAEAAVLVERGSRIAEAVGQISVPDRTLEQRTTSESISPGGTVHSAHRDVG